MKKVWKYKMKSCCGEPLILHLPIKAKVVLVAIQRGRICLWIEMPEGATEFRQRTYHVVGTNRPIGIGVKHCGSLLGGQFVWHIYEQEE